VTYPALSEADTPLDRASPAIASRGLLALPSRPTEAGRAGNNALWSASCACLSAWDGVDIPSGHEDPGKKGLDTTLPPRIKHRPL